MTGLVVTDPHRVHPVVASVWGLLVLGCLITAGVFVGLALDEGSEGRTIEAEWRRVEATVARTSSSRNDDGTYSHFATLEYVDEAGDRHTFEAGASAYAYGEERYAIFYDPRHPDRAARPPSWSRMWIGAGVFGLVGVAFLGIGVRVLRREQRVWRAT